ncbi:MAG: S8 family serine peptidase, partial [Clostridia bacterium]|nr:S8 family serine peptidase [Clostridia bacterium]
MQKKMKFLSLFLSVALLVTGIAPVEAAAYATPAFSTNQVMTLDDQTITPANPEDPQDLQNPQSPENPEDIQNPQSPENPEDPQNPQTPVTPVNPEIPETPQEPETPAISENEIPETPDVTELPETLDVSVSENVISENELPLAGTLSAEQVLAKRELVADIKTVAEAKEGTDYVAGEVLYLCDDSKQAEEAAAAYGATVKSFNNGVAVLLIPKEQTVKAVMNTAADQTNQLPAVYPNYYRRLLSETPANESFTDPYTKTQSEYYQYYHELVNSKYVWKAAESKKTGINERLGDIVVAVLDSGINTAHEDFEGVIVDAKAMVDGVTPEDENGHGSNVAGIIANKANDKGGRGVAAGVKIMSLRLSEAGEEGDITDAAVIAAINYASNPDDEFDVRVMNMSIGDEKYSSIYQEPIKKARQNGIVVVAAAGNGSTDGDICPACIDGVVSVGSVNSEYQKSNFSNYGPHVDISAPGGDINPDLTQPGYIRAERNWASGHVREGKVNTYLSMAGTSQASPIVAAAAA